MRTPLLVGVQHDTEGHLLNRHCQEQFTKKIHPLIGKDTLLLLEGDHKEPYYGKWHPFYLWRKREARVIIGAPIGYPTIAWRDERFIDPDDYERIRQLYVYANHHVLPFIVLPKHSPTTLLELLRLITPVRVEYEIIGEPEKEGLRHYCSKVIEWHERFDKTMIASAREWEASGRQAIILCGNIHALTIHRSTGWPMMCLADTPDGIRKLTLHFVTSVLYPEAVLARSVVDP